MRIEIPIENQGALRCRSDALRAGSGRKTTKTA